MFGMRYTPCLNMPRKRSKFTEMPEKDYRGIELEVRLLRPVAASVIPILS